MNEQILELARQVWPDPNTSHANHEKFALLIVRECVNKIAAEQDMADQNWSCKNGKHIAWEMLDHFGVDT